MEKSQLAIGMRPMEYSMPSSEKYDEMSFSCKVELMLKMLIPAASEIKE